MMNRFSPSHTPLSPLQRFYKSLGIIPQDISRVNYAWFLRLLYQIGTICASTILIALFVERFGIVGILWFFLGSTLLFMLNGIIYGTFLHKVKADFMVVLLSSGGLFLFFSGIFLPPNNDFFLFTSLGALGFFFRHTSIFLHRVNEEIFRPNEARVAMPVVDTAITIGNILGAAMTVILLGFLPLQQVLWLFALSMALIALMVLLQDSLIHSIPHLGKIAAQQGLHCEKKELGHPFQICGKKLKEIPYLRHIALLLFVQAAVFSFIEVEFIRDLQSHFAHSEIEHAEPLHDSAPGTQFIDPVHFQASLIQDIGHATTKAVKHVGEAAQSAATGIAHTATEISSQVIAHKTLAHDLGMFHLIFGILALIVQILLTPKCLSKFGIVRSMGLYNALLSVSLVLAANGLCSVPTLRAIQHGTHSVGDTAYHISYYSFFSSIRESVRIFLEGLIKPLGVLLSLGMLWTIPANSLFIIGSLGALSLVMITPMMQKSFTDMSAKTLAQPQEIEEALDSVEVLSQKGHRDKVRILAHQLERDTLPNVVRIKIIQALTDADDPDVVHTYISLLEAPTLDTEIRIQVLQSIFHIPSLQEYWNTHKFTQRRITEILQKLRHHDHPHVRKLSVMNLFRHMSRDEVADFFLDTIAETDEHLMSVYLRSTRMFHDPALQHYIEPYILDQNPRIRGHAIIGLWQYGDQKKMKSILDDLLADNALPEALIAALYAIGEVQADGYEEILLEFCTSANKEIRLHALIALAKFEDNRCVNGLLGIFFGSDLGLSRAAHHMLKRIPIDMQRIIITEVHHHTAEAVSRILAATRHDLSLINGVVMAELKHLYTLGRKYDDILMLEKLAARIAS